MSKEWKHISFAELITERKDKFDPKSSEIQHLSKIDKIDFSEGKIHLAKYSPTKTKQIIVEPGDFVFSGLNIEKGALAFNETNHQLVVSANYSTCSFDDSKVRLDFFKHYMRSRNFQALLKENLKKDYGFTRPKHLMPLTFPVPKDKAEQEWIVEGYKRGKNIHSKLRDEITHQRTLLSKLRQAILQEAIQGKLTTDWRAANPKIELASELLQRIQAEKARLIAAKKSRKEKPLPEITQKEIPFEIPESWKWCRLGAILEEKPRNGLSLKPVDFETPTKTLKLSATSSGTFDASKSKFLNVKIENDSYLWLKDGDILIQRANSLELVGMTAVYRGPESKFIYPDLMMKCRSVISEGTDYLHFLLSSPLTRGYFLRSATGSAGNMPKINQRTVLETLVPLPPLAEQAAIVKRVKALMALCRELEAEIDRSSTHAADLLQAVLKEAFSPTK